MTQFDALYESIRAISLFDDLGTAHFGNEIKKLQKEFKKVAGSKPRKGSNAGFRQAEKKVQKRIRREGGK